MIRAAGRFLAALGRAAGRLARRQSVLAPIPARVARLEHCHPCESNAGGICQECSCVIQAKVLLASEECPKKKWRKIV